MQTTDLILLLCSGGVMVYLLYALIYPEKF